MCGRIRSEKVEKGQFTFHTCKVNIEPPDTSGYKSVKIYIIEGAYYVYGKD